MSTKTLTAVPTKTFTVPADLEQAVLVRALAKEFFAAVGFDTTWTNRLTLVVDELFINAVQYGSHLGDTVECVLSEPTAGTIHCSLTDTGAQDTSLAELITKIKQCPVAYDPKKTAGRGLAVFLKNWTDNYTIKRATSGGLTISFVKKI